MDKKSFRMVEPTDWFRNFRWFESSEGFKVACATTAEQNNLLMERYAEPNDLVFYADLPNSRFVLVKPYKGNVDEKTKKEAAEFAAANSEAWKKNLTHVDVYCVLRSQIKRHSEPSKAFGSSSFMIFGERTRYKNVDVRLSIGVKLLIGEKVPLVVCAPSSAIRHNADFFVTLKPGMRSVSDIAATIRNRIFLKVPDRFRPYVERVRESDIYELVPDNVVEII
ncbi:MAG: NFACT RNA binding domain-containing protein [Candidatus Aenigmatarchaeota archaeon]